MDAYREAVEQALLQFPLLMQQGDEPVTQPQEGGWQADMPPQPLRSAMRYSLLLPGKRLRKKHAGSVFEGNVLRAAAHGRAQCDRERAQAF